MATADVRSAAQPVVSVVVPTYQRADRLGRLLAALAAQDLDAPFEVVMVDDGSTDGTASAARARGMELGLELRVLRQPSNQGPSAARNAGWRAAKAPLVAFTDDDCAPGPGWLRALVAAGREAAVVQGRTVPDPEQALAIGPFSRTVTATEEGLYPTCNVAYHRALLEQLGGFDESFRRSCDDTDLAWRARELGVDTAFAADAVVHHEVSPSSFRSLLRSLPRWDDAPLAVRRHPHLRRYLTRRLFWRRGHPAALAAAGGLVIAAAFPRLRPIGLAAVLPYADLRLRRDPLPGTGPFQRLRLLPLALVVDLAEVAVMAKGSIRHRTLVL